MLFNGLLWKDTKNKGIECMSEDRYVKCLLCGRRTQNFENVVLKGVGKVLVCCFCDKLMFVIIAGAMDSDSLCLIRSMKAVIAYVEKGNVSSR